MSPVLGIGGGGGGFPRQRYFRGMVEMAEGEGSPFEGWFVCEESAREEWGYYGKVQAVWEDKSRCNQLQ